MHTRQVFEHISVLLLMCWLLPMQVVGVSVTTVGLVPSMHPRVQELSPRVGHRARVLAFFGGERGFVEVGLWSDSRAKRDVHIRWRSVLGRSWPTCLRYTEQVMCYMSDAAVMSNVILSRAGAAV